MNQHVQILRDRVVVGIFGPTDRLPARQIATRFKANRDKICLIKSAGNAADPGFLKIMEAEWGQANSTEYDVYADGIVLTESHTAAVFFTADCPMVILLCRLKNGQIRVVAVHAGRPAMTPATMGDGSISNIITRAYKELVSGFEVVDVQVYITGAICGWCFLHDLPEAQSVAEPFEKFGEYAFIDRKKGTIDLVGIIMKQLVQLGVPKENIVHDGYCTKNSDWLASYRRSPGTTERNAIVVVLR